MPDTPTKNVNEVILRTYPKVIFFWPMALVSLILWLLQMLYPTPLPLFGNIWLIVFFVNMFIVAFDFSSSKFFVLIMLVVVVVLLLVFLVPGLFTIIPGGSFNPGLTAQFYLVMTIIMAFILGVVVLSSRFDYWKIERNEIYHKKGIFSSAERMPTKSLRILKEIPDVFEFFILRAGSITLMPGHGDVIHLNTVLNINKKQNQIDFLLSHVSIEPDELDG
ncbi:MAG: hypothetical protein E3J90_09355 [Promethearchaeota archaeon]|nr:MAG: hypothetical protein E3J90_09355 [Candidatus Lokiarchaeota archaeon]